MGGGGKSSGPSINSQDFTSAAEQQGLSSQQNTNQQTQANRPNQTNAFGATSNWTKDANGNWTQQSNLTGDLGTAASNLKSQIADQGQLDTGTQARDQAITGAYNQATSRLDPQWQQQEEQQRSQLAAQGLDPGSEAWNAEMGNMSRSKNDAYTSAMNSAIGQGTSAQQATFNENLQAQNNPYQQLSSLNSLTGQSSVPQAGKADTTQYLSATNDAYQAALNSFGIQQQGKNSTMGGLGSLAGTGISALSDERLKRNIHRWPIEALPGVRLASWEWIDGPPGRHFGVVAQDLEKVRPDLVTIGDDGYRRVNYAGLPGVFHG